DEIEPLCDLRVRLDDRFEQVLGRLLRTDQGEIRPGLSAVAVDLMAADAGEHRMILEYARPAPCVARAERAAIRRERIAASCPLRFELVPARLHPRVLALVDRVEQLDLCADVHFAR